MDVRDRDDAGWDDLPGGLSFADDGDGDSDDVRPEPRRGLRTALWLVVLAVLLGAGGTVGARWVASSDVRSVLASSTATYGQLLTRLREAPDASALAVVAGRADAAADRLDDDLARLRSTDSARRRAVAAQVSAERDVLQALAGLAGLPEAPLRVWGDVQDALAPAVDAETTARADLRRTDSAAALRLPDTAAVVGALTSTVGQALVGDVARSSGELLAELQAATRTGDLRAAAGRAEAQRTAVVAAQDGLRAGVDAQVLAAFADALQAVSELRGLSLAETGSWSGVRARLADTLGVVAGADDSLDAGEVRGRLPLVLAALDRLVARAAQAHAEWQPVRDAATAEQARDAAELRRYALQVRSAAAGWPALRTTVQALSGQQPGELAADASAAVRGAAADADALRTALGPQAPAGVEAAHAGLLAAVDGVSGPLVGTAVPPAAVAPTTAGTVVVDVEQAGAALAAWEPALAAWEAAVAAAEQAVAGRELPPPPDV